MKNGMFLKSMVVVGIVASVAGATDLFKDDFSDCAKTFTDWVPSNDTNSIVATCGGGVYTVRNKQQDAGGLMLYTKMNPKPASLTASVKISRDKDSSTAGFFICMQTSPSVTGYAIQLNAAQSISVYKYSPAAKELYFNVSSYIRGGVATNVITITKIANKIYLSCNDHFIDVVTDAANPLPDGDFALFISPKSTTIFDDVLITDQSTIPVSLNCFIDNFNDNLTYPWGDLNQQAPAAEINNQYLSINTMNSSTDNYHYTDIKVDTFSSKTILSFRKGSKSSLYGFFFKGPVAAGANRIPMAFFAFNGNKQFDAFIDTVSMAAIGSSFIYGPPYISGTDTTYFWDTLEVIKTTNSSYYKMFVNGNLLDSLSNTKANFAINGVGVFCSPGLLVYFDSFYIKSGLCSPVTNTSRNTKQLLRRAVFNPSVCEYLVDPLGRKLKVLNLYDRGNEKAPLAPGFYISNNRKSGVVVKKK